MNYLDDDKSVSSLVSQDRGGGKDDCDYLSDQDGGDVSDYDGGDASDYEELIGGEPNINSDDLPDDALVDADLDLQPDAEFQDANYSSDYDDSDDYDSDDDHYLQKLDDVNKKNIIKEFHPELLQHNHYEIEALTRVVRNQQGVIVDPLHKTIPFITKYERARILGERAKQINMGAKPLIEIGPEIIDGYLIAEKEFSEKKIPFIVKRPLPNGGCEYWKFKDLEVI